MEGPRVPAITTVRYNGREGRTAICPRAICRVGQILRAPLERRAVHCLPDSDTAAHVLFVGHEGNTAATKLTDVHFGFQLASNYGRGNPELL